MADVMYAGRSVYSMMLFCTHKTGLLAAILVSALLATLPLPQAFAADPMQAFPPAAAGMVRHVIDLPQRDDESALKVELIVGKTVTTDADSGMSLGARGLVWLILSEQTLCVLQ